MLEMIFLIMGRRITSRRELTVERRYTSEWQPNYRSVEELDDVFDEDVEGGFEVVEGVFGEDVEGALRWLMNVMPKLLTMSLMTNEKRDYLDSEGGEEKKKYGFITA